MTADEVLFILLRSGLWGTVPMDLAGEVIDWEAVFSLSRQQAVSGLVYQGVSLLPESQMPPAEERMKLMVEAGRIGRQAEKVRETAQKVVAELTEAGFSPLVFKGPAVARYYQNPELRTSGDIDIFLPGGAGPAAELFVHKGIQVLKESDGAFRITRDGITVELHPRYYDLHKRVSDLPDVPSPCAQLLMLSSHILKHAIGVGIGLKQFCDIAMAFAALKGQYEPAEYLSFVNKAGLTRWNDMLCSFLAEHLGAAPEVLPAYRRVRTDRLLGIVMEGGNFGQHSEGFKVSKAYTAGRFLAHLRFSLRISPCETLGIIRDLAKGNIG